MNKNLRDLLWWIPIALPLLAVPGISLAAPPDPVVSQFHVFQPTKGEFRVTLCIAKTPQQSAPAATVSAGGKRMVADLIVEVTRFEEDREWYSLSMSVPDPAQLEKTKVWVRFPPIGAQQQSLFETFDLGEIVQEFRELNLIRETSYSQPCQEARITKAGDREHAVPLHM